MTSTSTHGSSKRESHNAKAFYARHLAEYKPDLVSVPSSPDPRSIDKLICSSSEKMKEVASNSVALMVTSPPYHVGKDYDTAGTFADHLKLLRNVFTETYRVLEPGGRAAINVTGLGRKPYVPLHTYVDVMMIELGYFPRGEIIWIKAEGAGGSCAWGTFGSPRNPVLRDLHEKVLVYSKGRMDRHPSKGKAKTMDSEAFMRDTLSVWKIPPASAKRVGHPAPFPVELPRRLVELYTFPGDLVLDPFLGAGTTAIAARDMGRKFVGYDNDPDYIKLALKRLEESK